MMDDQKYNLPLVSVIMSAYNAEQFISKSIESVLNQTFTDFEFLIIDDCSSDRTLNIVQEFRKKDSRIKLITREKNNGLEGYINNLNDMISVAKGKYISKFDADDIWMQDKLLSQIQDIENNSDIFLLSSNAYIINEKDEITGEIIRPDDYEETCKMILKNNPFCHPSILFRNKGYLYRSKMLYTEEYDLYLRMYADGKKLVQRPDFLFKYRVLNNSMSKANIVIQALFKTKAIEFYHQRIKKGVDDYDEFDPRQYLQIFNPNFINTIEVLSQSLKLAFISNSKFDFFLILEKAIKLYGVKPFYKYNLISFHFNFMQQLYKIKSS